MPHLGIMLPMAPMAVMALIPLIAHMTPMGLDADNSKGSYAFDRSNAFDGACGSHGSLALTALMAHVGLVALNASGSSVSCAFDGPRGICGAYGPQGFKGAVPVSLLASNCLFDTGGSECYCGA